MKNIPIRTEEAARIRVAFLSIADTPLADYAELERRILAGLTE